MVNLKIYSDYERPFFLKGDVALIEFYLHLVPQEFEYNSLVLVFTVICEQSLLFFTF